MNLCQSNKRKGEKRLGLGVTTMKWSGREMCIFGDYAKDNRSNAMGPRSQVGSAMRRPGLGRPASPSPSPRPSREPFLWSSDLLQAAVGAGPALFQS